MKINTVKLRNALSIVKPGLSSKEVLEQTTSFAFSAGRVITYNDEISLSHPFEGEFEGAIKAEELYGLLSKIDKDEIEMEINDTQLLIKSGRIKAGLKLESEIRLPLKSVPDKMEKLTDPKVFLGFLSMALKTCSHDMTQPKLTCVSVGSDGVLIGSDSYRLIYCEGPKLPVESFLLPASSALEVVKTNPTHIALEKGWAHFKNADGTVISCRKIEDTYISDDRIEDVLTVKGKNKIEFPAKIEEVISRVQQFAKRDSVLDELVEVSIDNGKITLKASSEETGSWIEEKASIDFEGTIKFNMTPSLLRDIFNLTHTALLDPSLTKMKFVGKGWEYVLMLRN